MKVLEAIRVLDRNGRFAPKVLDADGVEIRVGDTVWDVEDGTKYEVCEVVGHAVTMTNGGYYSCSFPRYCPSHLTHRAPVLAADGKPLREGETVWDVDGRGPLAVWSLPEKSDMHVSLKKDGTFCYRHPEKLTHERPDSWERLEEDAEKDPCDYFGFDGEETCGKCPASGKNCEQTMAIDLVRRCRALAERERGE